MTWDQDDALRDALIAELAAGLPGTPQPGDITAEDFATARGVTVHVAQYQLEKLERAGRLTSVKVRWPGKRTAIRVWRRAS